MKKANIHIFQYASNPVCSPYRLDYPGDLLNQQQGITVTRFTKLNAKVLREVINHADMLIVQRLPMSPVVNKIFAELHKRGILMIFEIDDDLLHLNPNSEYAKQVPEDYGLRITNSILASQAVQCSTFALADKISKYHPEVAVLENQLPKIPAFSEKDFTNRPVIIGYAAGEHHLTDWLIIKDQYNLIISELESSGHNLETWIIGDLAIFESLTTKRKKFFPLLPCLKYLELLKLFDISIIPLADTEFNQCKSDIKFLESAACGAVVLASSVVYSNAIKNGETGLLYGSAEEFGDYLKELVSNHEQRTIIAQNAHKYVSKNRLLERHISNWENTYLNWYGNREELLRNTPVFCQSK